MSYFSSSSQCFSVSYDISFSEAESCCLTYYITATFETQIKV